MHFVSLMLLCALCRVEVQVMVEPSRNHEDQGVIGLSPEPQDEALTLSRRESVDPSEPLDPPQDPQSLYKDIWSLRASLEQHAASDQSSNNDRNSVCSDADSVCSLGGRTEVERGGGLPSFPSQDLGDEAEGGEDERDALLYADEKARACGKKEEKETSKESERRSSDSESGTRRLLQMDSGYASIEAPCRGPEEMRLFGSAGGSSKDRTAHERRHHFTSAGRTGTIGESFESHLFEEEPEDDSLLGASGGVSIETGGSGRLSWFPYGQMLTPREAAHLPLPQQQQPPPPPLTLHRRDYSIDEKTDALFHEFLRHDPQFDQQESPLRKHRSRIHLRKQWQRHKQWSDPGVRHLQSSLDRHRTPLRRGDSVNYPLDGSYHSPLPRIVSAPDEDTSDGTGSTTEIPRAEETGSQEDHSATSHLPPAHEKEGEQQDSHEDCKQSVLPSEMADVRSAPRPSADLSGYGPQTITAELTDKLTATLDERLYTGLRRSRDTACECVTVTATHASPDHSPV